MNMINQLPWLILKIQFHQIGNILQVNYVTYIFTRFSFKLQAPMGIDFEFRSLGLNYNKVLEHCQYNKIDIGSIEL